jgi:mRNA interferase MazF
VRLGDVWWADLSEPHGSEPGFRRPVVIVQSNGFNRSHIQTVVVAAITSNLRLASAPGNVSLTRRGSGLSKESVVNVSQILSLDKRVLSEHIGKLSSSKLSEVQDGLRLVLAL